MAVYRGTTPLKPYVGDGKPLNVYLGSTKLAGWTLQSYSGASLDVTGTYEDSVDVTVSGNTVVHNGALSGVEGKTLTCRTVDDSRSSSVAMPTLRKVGSVADTYVPATGAYAKAISDVVTLDGSKPWAWSSSNSSYTAALITLSPNPLSTTALVTKYDGSVLPTPGGAPDGYVISLPSGLYLALGYPDTGWNPTMTPTAAEIKAYFYGWRMCNADGSSPYYHSEIPYTPSTWAEWAYISTKGGSIVGNSLTVANASAAYGATIGCTIKPSTKYGFLVHVQNNTRTATFFLSAGGPRSDMRAFSASDFAISAGTVGNVKTIITSASVISQNVIFMYAVSNSGSITVDSYRIFELPSGSQIETDFTNLTADQLAAKYTFNGLCVKNWQHVTDGLGQTATLPTASYTGYTPYRMLYQLATPTTTTQTAKVMPTYRDETVVETDADAWCQPTISATVKSMD